MKRYLLLVIVAMVCLASCKDQNDYTPAILKIDANVFDDCFNVDNYNMEHDDNLDVEQLQALKQHKFTHVYISYDGKALGVWELPCEVPVLDINSSDSTTLNIIPCFKKNGQSSTIKGYSYIKSYKLKLNLQKGKTTYLNKDNFKKKYEYHKYTEAVFVETFNTNQHFMPYDMLTSTANFNCIADPDNTSNRLGEIVLTNDSLHNSFEVITKAGAGSDSWIFDVSNQTYLEIRYKCDNEMKVEVVAQGYYTAYPCGGMYATKDWQTIYINLDERLGSIYSTGSYFSGYIGAQILLSGARLPEQDTTRFTIDYVKIISGPNS